MDFEMQHDIHMHPNILQHVYWHIYILRKAIPSGMIAGAMGQFIASPTDRIKVILQMEGRQVLDGCAPR